MVQSKTPLARRGLQGTPTRLSLRAVNRDGQLMKVGPGPVETERAEVLARRVAGSQEGSKASSWPPAKKVIQGVADASLGASFYGERFLGRTVAGNRVRHFLPPSFGRASGADRFGGVGPAPKATRGQSLRASLGCTRSIAAASLGVARPSYKATAQLRACQAEPTQEL